MATAQKHLLLISVRRQLGCSFLDSLKNKIIHVNVERNSQQPSTIANKKVYMQLHDGSHVNRQLPPVLSTLCRPSGYWHWIWNSDLTQEFSLCDNRISVQVPAGSRKEEKQTEPSFSCEQTYQVHHCFLCMPRLLLCLECAQFTIVIEDFINKAWTQLIWNT